jgi:GDP-L-fucose synthase
MSKFTKTSKILVTGSSGMVGKNMCELLESKGFENIIKVSSKEVDLRDQKATATFFEDQKPEYVFHFAAKVGGIMANINDPIGFCHDNLMISSNVIMSSYKAGVKKLINLGSSCIYPRLCPQPIKEEYMLTGEYEPTNEGYAIAKTAALKLCEYLNKQNNTCFLTIIPPNLYGEYERFDAVNSHVLISLVHKFHDAVESKAKNIELWGTGNPVREFLYVKDLTKAALYFMENVTVEQVGNMHTNVGTGEGISIQALAEMIAQKMNFKGEIKFDKTKPDGMPKKVMDISRLKKLGFVPETDLSSGLDRFIKYLFSNDNSRI